MDFLSLPPSKLKNKVICDLHFKEESFMNYKRERLIKNAVPNIYVKDGEEIDLLLNPEPYVIENNQKPVLSNSVSIQLNVSSPIDLVENKEHLYQLLDEVEVPVKRMKTDNISAINTIRQVMLKPIAASSKFTVLNKNVSQKSTNSPRTLQDPVTSLVQATSKPIKLAPALKKEPVSKKFNVINNEVSKPTIEESLTSEYMVITMPMEEMEEVDEIPVVEPILTPTVPTQEIPVDFMPMLMDSLKQIGEIKTILNVKQEKKPSTIKEESASPMTPSQLNKVQLFNGIKRYLSPAMQALLRIELFSNPEREYKQDEKVLSTEILKLGNPVYDFLCEEWRLRLPPKKDVQLWINEQLNTEDDDAC